MKHFKIKDYLISLLIISVTLLYFYVTYIVPKDLKTINVFGFEIGSFGFHRVYELIHFSKMKLLIIIFAIVWYITCKHWWRSAILVIIFIELLKLFSVFNTELEVFDEIEYYLSLPITIPIILILILISNKLNKSNVLMEIRLNLDREIDKEIYKLGVYDKMEIRELEYCLKNLIKKKHTMPKDKYKSELLLLRDKFYKNI